MTSEGASLGRRRSEGGGGRNGGGEYGSALSRPLPPSSAFGLRWLKNGLAAWLPALPLLLLAGALLVAPTIQLIVQSLRGSTGHWTLEFWRDALATSKGDVVVAVYRSWSPHGAR